MSGGFGRAGSVEEMIPNWSDLPHSFEAAQQGTTSKLLEARGWPRLCLWLTRDMTTPWGSTRLAFGDADGGWETRRVWRTRQGDIPISLPHRVLSDGFIINTLFYAAMWFGIFFGVGFVKRVLRRKRGRCVKCSYDLRGEFDTGCPECGWGREP